MGGAETLGGIAPGVGSDAFAAEATSTGRSRAFDHPKPRANPAGGEGWITPPPRTHGRKPRKVNREKKNVEERPWTLRAGDDARGSSTVTAVVCAHLNEPE